MEEEHARRLAERWKFNADNSPAIGPHGTDEPARMMIWIRYTNSPLLMTIMTLSCQPFQESTHLNPPLSLQHPQCPQHHTPLSTLQSTHQTHIHIQSKQYLQPSSHVPTP